MSELEGVSNLNIDFTNGFTIECKFDQGSVEFVFELGPLDKPKSIYLYRKPIVGCDLNDALKSRLYGMAVDYLVSCGYEVESVPA